MHPMSITLREKDVKILRAIVSRFPSVSDVRIFGSRAKGIARRTSDIDLAIRAPRMSEKQWIELRAAIAEAPIIYPIDVIRLDTLKNSTLQKKIEQEGIRIL